MSGEVGGEGEGREGGKAAKRMKRDGIQGRR